jgi:hypothetical protein
MASTVPVIRTWRLTRGVSGGAAWVTGGAEGEQEAKIRTGIARDSREVMNWSRVLDGGNGANV